MGKGAAIKSAIPFINGNIVAIQDADLEYNPYDLNKLIKALINDNLNVVYGSKYSTKKDMAKSSFHTLEYLAIKFCH